MTRNLQPYVTTPPYKKTCKNSKKSPKIVHAKIAHEYTTKEYQNMFGKEYQNMFGDPDAGEEYDFQEASKDQYFKKNISVPKELKSPTKRWVKIGSRRENIIEGILQICQSDLQKYAISSSQGQQQATPINRLSQDSEKKIKVRKKILQTLWDVPLTNNSSFKKFGDVIKEAVKGDHVNGARKINAFLSHIDSVPTETNQELANAAFSMGTGILDIGIDTWRGGVINNALGEITNIAPLEGYGETQQDIGGIIALIGCACVVATGTAAAANNAYKQHQIRNEIKENFAKKSDNLNKVIDELIGNA